MKRPKHIEPRYPYRSPGFNDLNTVQLNTNKMAKAKTKAGASRKQPAKKVVKLGNPEDTYDQINQQMDELSEQMSAFGNGKKVAVSRARKAANEMRKLLAVFRKEIQAAKANM